MNFIANKIKGQSLWADATRRLLRDKFAVFSFVIILIYIGISLSVKFGILAADWQQEIGPSRAAPDLPCA